MKNILLLCLVSIISCVPAKAQHFYYKLDVGTSNIYSFAVTNIATAWLNKATDRMLFNAAYTYTHPAVTGTGADLKTRNYNVAGITAHDVFADITTGAKLGYQSFSPGLFNWGIFGSAHYRINQFESKFAGAGHYGHNNLQRLQVGGGLMLNLGEMESPTRVTVEAGLRYNIPLKGKDADGTIPLETLQKGLSSHYAIRINGRGALQGIGIYADIPHHKVWKTPEGSTNVKLYTFGIVYTITPWKIK